MDAKTLAEIEKLIKEIDEKLTEISKIAFQTGYEIGMVRGIELTKPTEVESKWKNPLKTN